MLCDVQDGTGLLDLDAARAMVGLRTAAILAVHLYGQTCDMTAINSFAELHGLLVLEDAAQAHGARYRGRRAGSLGAAAAFSFYPSNNLGALGDGGAITTDDEMLAARLRRLRNLGQRAKGEHVEVGYNERLDALQAAMLRVKLACLDAWNQSRQTHAAHYRGLLPAQARVVEEHRDSPSVHRVFAVRFADRDAVAESLNAEGIETAVHYPLPVHRHRAWANLSVRHDELPVAERWAAEELSLPMHPGLMTEEIERVVSAIRSARPRPRGLMVRGRAGHIRVRAGAPVAKRAAHRGRGAGTKKGVLPKAWTVGLRLSDVCDSVP